MKKKSEKRKDIKTEDGLRLINEACTATDSSMVKKLRKEAITWERLPIDCMNEESQNEQEINKLMTKMSKQFKERIAMLNAGSDLVYELCCLRDLIFIS